MSNTAIKVENLSKIYRLGEIGTGTISRDMERWFKTKVLKQEDPFLKIGETNDRAKKGKSDIVYSLEDINFEIEQGAAVGIIGRNGAGKSTLLKILSRVTTPTTGRINIKGRVASLLEVGTGFHPELTGRENIYLNGAILGMRKKEIDRKLDEIIDFSGVERYIDTPVKRYSSGMYVRLAFAVAAHLESEILIVDEVLAVGDAEFQKKCLGKMGEVSKGEGRTVLFVSHNLISVKKLCNEGIVLFEGKNFLKAPIDLALNSYLSLQENQTYNTTLIFEKNLNLPMQIESVALADYDNGVIFKSSNQIVFVFEVNVISNIEASYIAINVYDNDDQLVYWTADFESDRFVTEKVGRFSLKCKLPNNILTAGKYKANFAIFSPIKGVVQYDEAKNISFKVEDNNDFLNQFNINYPGKTAVPSNWNLI